MGDWLDATEEYSVGVIPTTIGVYFRYVDQSESDIQDQMINFVTELEDIQAITKGPSNFWLYDFREFVDSGDSNTNNMTFNEQLDQFLDNEIYNTLYGNDIVRD